MARNGSGTYTVPNSFVSGTAITAAAHNQNWSDIASEITNSIAADGQTPITGALKGANGSVALPAYAFASDTDSGLYRAGANNPAIAAGGTKILDITTSGATVTGTADATTVKQGGFTLLPPGVFFPYAGATLPDGYLWCNGEAVSRATYAALFTAIGTTFGAGDSSTTFNLPDLCGRVAAGKDDMGGISSKNRLTNQTGGLNGDTLGATGGNETNNQVITHTHGAGSLIADSATVIIDILRRAFATSGASDNQRLSFGNDGGVTGTFSTNATGAHTHTVSGSTAAPSGAVSAFNIVQPTIVSNYIIKT